MNAKPALIKPRFACDLDRLAALWIVRLSVRVPAVLYLLNESNVADELRRLVGVAPVEGALVKSELRAMMRVRAVELEEKRPERVLTLYRNVALLGDMLDLNDVEREILAMSALSQQHVYLQEVMENTRTTNIESAAKLIAVALKLKEGEVRRALLSDSQLIATGVLTVESRELWLSHLLVVPKALHAALFKAADSVEVLMRAVLEPAPKPTLTALEFEHLSAETELLSAYLRNARKCVDRGINILIYGPPGTGKTEYVRWLSRYLDRRVYQVRAADDQGQPISGAQRLSLFLLSQRFLRHSNALMFFDEMEDVFPTGGTGHEFFGGSAEARPGKMFINRVFESNPVPAIWVSNEIAHIDKSYLRRFDFSFEMGVPPIAARRRILNKYLRKYQISDATITTLSQHEQLSPAQVEKAAKVLKLSAHRREAREAVLLRVINNSMQLLEQETNDAVLDLAECRYQLDYLNADCDLARLVANIKNARDASVALCFYGAPGTGKTALAHFIARELERPLVIKRASDILSPYVGETEQRIAAMFQRAQRDGAILLLDEADSFLAERRAATTSWEVTGVNEMLTQMERFDGLFICSTNLMQRLDEASLRRFTFKIKFDFLLAEQRWRLFCEHVPRSKRSDEAALRDALSQLRNLTPGDFANVRRQSKLFALESSASDFVARLQRESRAKRDACASTIGFIQK